jgi:hypothetical protein
MCWKSLRNRYVDGWAVARRLRSELVLTVRRAAVAVHMAAVIALFVWVQYAIATVLERAVRSTSVADVCIRVVALLAKLSLHNPVTAELTLTSRAATIAGDGVSVVALLLAFDAAIAAGGLGFTGYAATIARDGVSVIALLTKGRLRSAIAAELVLTGRATAIARDVVSIVTLLLLVQDSIAAVGLYLTSRAAAIAGDGVPVIALLEGIQNAVAAYVAVVGSAGPHWSFDFAGRVAAIAGDGVSVIALFTKGGLRNAIAAKLVLTGRATAIARDVVPVVALLLLVQDSITAVGLYLASRAAAIAGDGVSVIALLIRLHFGVAAVRSELAARGAFTVAAIILAVVAFLRAAQDSVATVLGCGSNASRAPGAAFGRGPAEALDLADSAQTV